MTVLAVVFFLAACYQAGKAHYWKRRAEDPWTTAWRDFERRNLRDPRHPSTAPRSLPS